MKKVLALLCVCLLGCCAFTHRRVIAACIKGEPMPAAPKWHFWVNKENRRA